MKLAMMLSPQPGPTWKLAKQAGVDCAVTNFSRVSGDTPLTHAMIAQIKEQFAEAGLDLAVHESNPFPLDRVKLGLPGRDEDIERYCELIGVMGAVGIPIICYNFMPMIDWYRTSAEVPARGGALATGFDYEVSQREPLTDAGVVEEERLWDNLGYFLERVLPVAEQAGVRMALHPDDPPISPLRGIGRILTSPEAFDRVLDMVPSEASGLGFCQGTFATMGVDVPETIRHFGRRGKIFFAHFRDVIGGPAQFRETFHDAGQTDMLAAMRAYAEVGFGGPIRPDHGPTMQGEANDRPGYGMTGRIFGLGYMKGLLESV